MSQPRPLEVIRNDLAVAIRAGNGPEVQNLVEQYKRGKDALRASLGNIKTDAEGYKTKTEKPFREGLGSSLVGSARAITSLLLPESAEPAWASRAARDEQTRLDAGLEGSGAASAGRFVGDMAVGALGGGLAGGALKAAVGKEAAKKGLAKAALWGVEGVGGSAAVTGEIDAKDAVMGMVGGKAAQALGNTSKAVARGLRRDPHAQTLLDYGADLTPGQLNPAGVWARLEGAAASSPFGVGGTAIREAQRAGVQPVVPNLVADIAGQSRRSVAGMNPREALDQAYKGVSGKYALADGIEIAPGDRTSLKLDRLGAAATAKAAKNNATQATRLGQSTARAKAARLAEDASVAVDRATANPGNSRLQAIADEKIALLREAEHAIKTLDPQDAVRAGNAAARAKLDDFVPSTMRDLSSTVESSLKRHALAKDAPIRRQIEVYAKEALNAKDAAGIKAMRSKIREAQRKARYGASPDFASANVLDDAEEWFTKLYERAVKNPTIIAKLRQADSQFAQLSPIREAAVRVGSNPDNLIPGNVLEDMMQKGMTDGGWVRGVGGSTRQVAEALRGLEAGNAKGALQSRGTPQLVALLQGSIGTAGASPTVRKLARGDTVLQRALAAGADSTPGSALKRALALMRPGLAATVASEDQPN